MPDLVVTCPKDFWEEWIAEGDAAGDPPTGEEWGWFMRSTHRPPIKPGERLYVVAHGKLRGYAPVTRVAPWESGWAICRQGLAVAVTIAQTIPGFRGYRRVWWNRDEEKPFPEWKAR